MRAREVCHHVITWLVCFKGESLMTSVRARTRFFSESFQQFGLIWRYEMSSSYEICDHVPNKQFNAGTLCDSVRYLISLIGISNLYAISALIIFCSVLILSTMFVSCRLLLEWYHALSDGLKVGLPPPVNQSVLNLDLRDRQYLYLPWTYKWNLVALKCDSFTTLVFPQGATGSCKIINIRRLVSEMQKSCIWQLAKNGNATYIHIEKPLIRCTSIKVVLL